MTAPTQWVTSPVVPVWGDGDRVSDGDRVVITTDEYFADDEPQDPLAFFVAELVEAVGEAGGGAFEGVGELEVGLGVVQVCLERVELGAQCALALAQRGHAGAQLVERDELFLVGLDQPVDGGLGAGDVALERLAAAGGGVLRARRLEPAVDLLARERRLLEQAADLLPDERFELVGADRAASAHAPADVPPVVLADAAVVDDPSLAGAGRGAVAGVAALAADDQALQRTGPPGVALGEARVVDQPGLREFEGLIGDERRDGDQRPRLGRLVLPRLATAVALAAPAGGARRLAVPLRHLRAAERGLPAVGGVAQHPPHRRAVPHRLARARGDVLLGQPPGDLRDRQVLLGVGVEDPAHHLGLRLVDLPVALVVLGLLDVAVAVGGRPTSPRASPRGRGAACRAGCAPGSALAHTRRSSPGTGAAARPRASRHDRAPWRSRPRRRRAAALRAAPPGRRSGARGGRARGRAAPRTRPRRRGRAAAQAPGA